MRLDDSITNNLLRYGIGLNLATRAEQMGLTLQRIRNTKKATLIGDHGFSEDEATELKNSVKRKPIPEELVSVLLERSNFVCCVCKGEKGKSYVIHHIVPYAETQDNTYGNLIVLCPNDHDLAHGSGLTMRITQKQLRSAKSSWEQEVIEANVRRAAQLVEVNEHTVDYINIRRIEQLSVSVLGNIPVTNFTQSLQRAKILDSNRSFDQKYVRNNLSGRNYLFDYIAHCEPEHYKQILEKIAAKLEFVDLEKLSRDGLGQLKTAVGHIAYFIGGVTSKGVPMPIPEGAPAVTATYRRKKFAIEWLLDPNYLMSTSAIGRLGQKYRYIIYFRVMSIETSKNGCTLIKGSPLLLAQPSCYVDKTPRIRYTKAAEAVDAWFEL